MNWGHLSYGNVGRALGFGLILTASGAYAAGLWPGLPAAGTLTGNERIPADTALASGASPQTEYITTMALQSWLIGNRSDRVNDQTAPSIISISTELDAQVRSFNRFQTNIAPTAASQNIEWALQGFANYTANKDLIGAGHFVGIGGWAQLNSAQTVGLVIGAEGKVGAQLAGGTITNAIGVESNLYTVVGSIIGNGIGFNADFANAGYLAHLIGYRCPDYSTLAVAPASDKSCFRNEDPAAGVLRRLGTGGSAVYGDVAAAVQGNSTTGTTATTGSLQIVCSGAIPATTLRNTGDRVEIKAYFNNAATANSKSTGLRIGANNLQSALAANNGLVSTYVANLKRTGTNTQTLIIEGHMGTTALGPSYFSASETETADIPIYMLQQNNTASEVTCLGFDAVYYPVPK